MPWSKETMAARKALLKTYYHKFDSQQLDRLRGRIQLSGKDRSLSKIM
jgi:hypothetical protein